VRTPFQMSRALTVEYVMTFIRTSEIVADAGDGPTMLPVNELDSPTCTSATWSRLNTFQQVSCCRLKQLHNAIALQQHLLANDIRPANPVKPLH
jgi:hypothetical protein